MERNAMNTMQKEDILGFLEQHEQADAFDLAASFEVPYATAAMALLRLTRQGLVQRLDDPIRGRFWYRLTTRGRQRLRYLLMH